LIIEGIERSRVVQKKFRKKNILKLSEKRQPSASTTTINNTTKQLSSSNTPIVTFHTTIIVFGIIKLRRVVEVVKS